MTKQCIVHRLGLVPYEQAWRLQDTLVGAIAAGEKPPTLLLLEHPHTYTFGRRGKIENLLWDEAELRRRCINVHWVDRGGDVTYHGPGQLVGYPLLPLAPGGMFPKTDAAGDPSSSARIPQVDYIGYLRKLERTLVQALFDMGVASKQVEGLTGVWLESELGTTQYELCKELTKIAAIGVKVDAKGISRHGFALNVNPDMTYWEGIVGCGLHEYREASLAELIDPALNMQQTMDRVVSAFGETFGYLMVETALDF